MSPSQGEQQGSPRILVIDDESSIRELLRAILEHDGFEVTTADCLTAGLAELERDLFDVAIVDKNLPDGSGLGVARAVRERELDTAVVLITAYSNKESAIDALRLGVSDYLEKPLEDIDVISTLMRRILHVQSLERKVKALVVELQEKNKVLEALSVIDPLTELYNHAYLQDVLERELVRSKRHEESCSVLFLDLDSFKKVNDTYGHLVGNELLKLVAQIIRGQGRRSDIEFRLRAADVAARFGGDEFAILLPETSKRGAAVKAERLRAYFDGYSFASHGLPQQRVSIGVATFPEDASTRAELIEAADMALYAAKRMGRNRIVAYTADMAAAKPGFGPGDAAEIRQYDALTHSIDTLAFEYHYQPIVAARSGAVLGYEALCRPTHPLFPDPLSLIKAAELSGRIAALGSVLRHGGAGALGSLPSETILFINLHPLELHDPRLASESPFVAPNAGRIVLEITEVAEIEDYQRVRQIIDHLHQTGFRIALDGLGSGYSGLNSLSQLNPDFVKLDKELARLVATDTRARRLVRQLIEFAAAEGMKVIAQGLETQHQADVLTELGCDYLQGFLISEPRPLAQVLANAARPGKKGAVAAT